MKEIKKISKENIKNLANSFGVATKNTVSNLGVVTKNLANTVTENVKESSDQLSKQIDQLKYDNDKKRLAPIYENELLSSEFTLPTIIRVVTYDKRKENKACEGAVGFITGKDIKILNIYREFVDLLNIDFYPYLEDSIYYVDPCHNYLYIKLEEYFSYLKKVRVDELTTIAQDLGAKHMEILLKSNSKSANSQNLSGSAHLLKLGASANYSKSQNEYSGVEVAAKIDFAGSDTPINPKLTYFKNERDIIALINMRLNPENCNKILSKTYSLKYGNSSGISINDAEKIDMAISSLNYGLNRSVSNEVMTENNTILEYSIAF